MLCKRTSKTAVSCLCVCVPFPISLPNSLTCKWQKDSALTFDTPPLCPSEGSDNCYGNGMSPRWVDWLIRLSLGLMSPLIRPAFIDLYSRRRRGDIYVDGVSPVLLS